MAAGAVNADAVRERPPWRAYAVGAGAVLAVLTVWCPPAGGQVRVAVGAAVMVALVAVAWARRVVPLRRALTYLATAFACYALGALADLPVAVSGVLSCVAPLAVLLAADRVPSLRPTAPWLRVGRPAPDAIVLAVAAVVVAAALLTVWTRITDPEPTGILRVAVHAPPWLAVLGVAGFGLVNGIVEEGAFRGVLLGALQETWGTPAAVVGQALVFGLAHWAGFPSGWVGMVMAACWGAALGVIRVRTGGILVPYVVHVLVDTTIGVLALVLLR